ncbi:cysteine desulfurase [Candidatus Woesearchaeota archaeon]|nr:cysteine desulfurase [Candidatus Woesearchaeota archaeon]
MNDIYLDNGASTRVDDEVSRIVAKYMTECYGNASSNHAAGERACEGLERARIAIAGTLNAEPDEIVFTSGGTESNNTVLKSIALSSGKKHIITSAIEHDCVINSCKWLESMGFDITYLKVDSEGYIDYAELPRSVRHDTFLVSIIHGNNETGTIQDLDKLSKICKAKGVLFHTDACQSYTKVPIDVTNLPIDFITINSHKIHGPKGVGALFIRKGIPIRQWQHGGQHEKGRRAGTENIAGIVGFAKAAELALAHGTAEIERLRDLLITGLLEIKGGRLNGPKKRLANNVNVSFAGADAEILLEKLNREGIFCSTGSACSAKKAEPSHVLKAIHLDFAKYPGAIRLTLSRFTTEDEINATISVFRRILRDEQ